MPPKKASGASKKESKKTNVEFENRKEEVLEEAERREERMYELIDQRIKQMLQTMLEAVEAFDPALRNMTVGQLMQMPVALAEDTKENEELRSAKEERAQREMTVANERQNPNTIQETAMRPHKPGRVLELRTPAGNAFKCPSLITPRVGGGSMTTRAIRPDEVAFSAAGSPIVMGGDDARGRSSELDQLHQLVNIDEATLTPTSRELVRNVKAIMQRRLIGDPV